MTKNSGLLTACRVAQRLDVSVKTLTNWYKWYNDDTIQKPSDCPPLPDYIQERPGAIRYWLAEDISKLRKFKKWIPHGRNGVMGKINEVYWSKDKRKSRNEETENS